MNSIEEVVQKKRKSAVFPIVCADHAAGRCQLSLAEVAADGEKLARVLEAAYNAYRYDMVLVFSDPYVEAEALGCRVRLDPQPRLAGPPLRPTEMKTARSAVRRGRTKEIMAAAQRLQDRLPVPVFVSVKGPFSLAAFAAGIEPFLKQSLADRPRAESYIGRALEFQLRYLELLLGLKVNIFIGDPLASASVISPELFARLACEPLRTLVKAVKDAGTLAGVHVCGETRPIIGMLDALGADILSIEDITPPTTTLKMGGVSTATIFSGDRQKIEPEVRIALTEPYLILATGCDVPATTPPHAISSMVEIGRSFDRAG